MDKSGNPIYFIVGALFLFFGLFFAAALIPDMAKGAEEQMFIWQAMEAFLIIFLLVCGTVFACLWLMSAKWFLERRAKRVAKRYGAFTPESIMALVNDSGGKIGRERVERLLQEGYATKDGKLRRAEKAVKRLRGYGILILTRGEFCMFILKVGKELTEYDAELLIHMDGVWNGGFGLLFIRRVHNRKVKITERFMELLVGLSEVTGIHITVQEEVDKRKREIDGSIMFFQKEMYTNDSFKGTLEMVIWKMTRSGAITKA